MEFAKMKSLFKNQLSKMLSPSLMVEYLILIAGS